MFKASDPKSNKAVHNNMFVSHKMYCGPHFKPSHLLIMTLDCSMTKLLNISVETDETELMLMCIYNIKSFILFVLSSNNISDSTFQSLQL